MTIAIYTHEDCLNHDTGAHHPENAHRLEVIGEALAMSAYAQELQTVYPPLATDEQILLAHEPEYLEQVHRARPTTSPYFLDNDTVMSPGSWEAALRAVGVACQSIDDMMADGYAHSFCAVRPPGHHATRNQAMGFCIFNNIAIAALYAKEQYGLERIVIIDFDVHHGNGTEDILKSENGIRYISTHQSPLFPGTGTQSAENVTNIPLPERTDGGEYRDLWERQIVPELDQFQPQLILVSAGFDAHHDDPLAGLALREADYAWIGKQIRLLAERHSQGRAISFLEGGYELDILGPCVASYLHTFSTHPASA